MAAVVWLCKFVLIYLFWGRGWDFCIRFDGKCRSPPWSAWPLAFSSLRQKCPCEKLSVSAAIFTASVLPRREHPTAPCLSDTFHRFQKFQTPKHRNSTTPQTSAKAGKRDEKPIRIAN
ncbi:hypothetical protein GWI33_022903 [Rhynchophorus ferrugineus]|uniref:Uncharacterized protein n=1 Tax=Rhynchophorus ferrugineus TaxID=354439 RepID=A0A834MH95_RHYFE|nr:hypothetical protein GWI33_022903 [Rhynchophorus ferrugineus]